MNSGTPKLDRLLGGGLEVGLMHLFYGFKLLREDLLRFAIQCQLPKGMVASTDPAS